MIKKEILEQEQATKQRQVLVSSSVQKNILSKQKRVSAEIYPKRLTLLPTGSNVFVIDSSVFVAFYYEGDSNHTEAVKIIEGLDSEIRIVHPYIIQETATVLAYKLGINPAVDFLEDVINSPRIFVPFVDIYDDISKFKRAGKKMSFSDVTLVMLAKRERAQLVTFDKQMLSLFNT